MLVGISFECAADETNSHDNMTRSLLIRKSKGVQFTTLVGLLWEEIGRLVLQVAHVSCMLCSDEAPLMLVGLLDLQFVSLFRPLSSCVRFPMRVSAVHSLATS